MIGDRKDIHRLTLIYNRDISKECVDISQEIRKEIIRILFGNTKIIGIASDSIFYTSSMELYRIDGSEGVAFAYLHLRIRDDNRVWYSISYQDNDIGSESCEFEYTSVKSTASMITKSLLEIFDFR